MYRLFLFMKIHVLYEHLQNKLSLVNKAISSRTQLPILQNMLLVGKDGQLIISGTDLEIGIQVKIPANIETEGAITLPAKSFLELVNSLPKGKITIEMQGKNVLVTTKNTKSTFQTITADDFPKLYEEKGEEIAQILPGVFQKTLSHILFAASVDTARPALSGIYIKKDESDGGKQFFVVATDGYRLSLVRNEIPLRIEKPLLISARALREMVVIKSDGKTPIKIYASEKSNQVVFEQEDVLVVGRLIEAAFPSYEKIIPQDVVTKVFFDREEMGKAVKMCAIFARESANIVRFSVKQGSITVTANAPQTGDNTVEVEAKVDGDNNEIAFNVRYLLDLFANMTDEEMILEMTTPTSPGVFKIKGDPTFLHLIMPIRVQQES